MNEIFFELKRDFLINQISSFLLNVFFVFNWNGMAVSHFVIYMCVWDCVWHENSISDFLKTSLWYVYKKVRKKIKMNPSVCMFVCVRVKHVKSFGIFHQYIYFLKKAPNRCFFFTRFFFVPYFEIVNFECLLSHIVI